MTDLFVRTYLVTANRWGCVNEHSYHVYAGIDRSKAFAMARSENADRGGKYATSVWVFDGDGTDYKLAAYHPSSLCGDDAQSPRHNHRVDYFQRIGQFIHEAKSGKALMPDPKDPTRLTYQSVGPLPDFVLAEVDRAQMLLQFWEAADKPSETRS